MSTRLANDVSVSRSGVYELLSEGLGGTIERIAYTNVIDRIAQKYNCKSVLEMGATYIAGIPGFNSCLLAQRGYDVTVLVSPRDYEDTKEVWRLTRLKANIIKFDMRFPSVKLVQDNYDLVYNHLAFEQQKDPIYLVDQMATLAKRVVVNLTLSPYNYGFFIHWLGHKMYRKPYNHGSMELAKIESMVKIHKQLGLKVIETGACDCPPWMDTVDGKIGNSMTYMDIFPSKIRNKWVWTTVNPECQNHKIVKRFIDWEEKLPFWFKKIFAHHFYCASLTE